jgi:glycosyltransferase involved in cell wall biosynthesis
VYTFSELEVDENLRPGKTGFICRPGDVLEFFTRASELIRDPDRRRTMGEAARRYACGRTWPLALDPLFSLYRAAVA